MTVCGKSIFRSLICVNTFIPDRAATKLSGGASTVASTEPFKSAVNRTPSSPIGSIVTLKEGIFHSRRAELTASSEAPPKLRIAIFLPIEVGRFSNLLLAQKSKRECIQRLSDNCDLCATRCSKNRGRRVALDNLRAVGQQGLDSTRRSGIIRYRRSSRTCRRYQDLWRPTAGREFPHLRDS